MAYERPSPFYPKPKIKEAGLATREPIQLLQTPEHVRPEISNIDPPGTPSAGLRGTTQPEPASSEVLFDPKDVASNKLVPPAPEEYTVTAEPREPILEDTRAALRNIWNSMFGPREAPHQTTNDPYMNAPTVYGSENTPPRVTHDPTMNAPMAYGPTGQPGVARLPGLTAPNARVRIPTGPAAAVRATAPLAPRVPFPQRPIPPGSNADNPDPSLVPRPLTQPQPAPYNELPPYSINPRR